MLLEKEIATIENELKLNPISTQLATYSKWLREVDEIPKSYRDHPLQDETALKQVKDEFEKSTGSSLGRYIRLLKVANIFQIKGENAYQVIQTPLGIMVVIDTNEGIALLDFCDRKSLPTQLIKLQREIGGFVEKKTARITQTAEELDAYFSKKQQKFTVKLNLIGTPFQKEVWKTLLKVPYGETCSYKEEAVIYGNPSAIRAIASANGKNYISIIIPCHRVIASDGSLGGYGGGLIRKRYLLDLERANK